FMITNGACDAIGNTNINNSCNQGNQNASSISSSFVANVMGDDVVNPIDFMGGALFTTLSDVSAQIGDYLNFAAPFRLWGRDGTFPTPLAQGDCISGNCRIWDWRIRNGEALHDRSGDGFGNNGSFSPGIPCPLEAHG